MDHLVKKYGIGNNTHLSRISAIPYVTGQVPPKEATYQIWVWWKIKSEPCIKEFKQMDALTSSLI